MFHGKARTVCSVSHRLVLVGSLHHFNDSPGFGCILTSARSSATRSACHCRQKQSACHEGDGKSLPERCEKEWSQESTVRGLSGAVTLQHGQYGQCDARSPAGMEPLSHWDLKVSWLGIFLRTTMRILSLLSFLFFGFCTSVLLAGSKFMTKPWKATLLFQLESHVLAHKSAHWHRKIRFIFIFENVWVELHTTPLMSNPRAATSVAMRTFILETIPTCIM